MILRNLQKQQKRREKKTTTEKTASQREAEDWWHFISLSNYPTSPQRLIRDRARVNWTGETGWKQAEEWSINYEKSLATMMKRDHRAVNLQLPELRKNINFQCYSDSPRQKHPIKPTLIFAGGVICIAYIYEMVRGVKLCVEFTMKNLSRLRESLKQKISQRFSEWKSTGN